MRTPRRFFLDKFFYNQVYTYGLIAGWPNKIIWTNDLLLHPCGGAPIEEEEST